MADQKDAVDIDEEDDDKKITSKEDDDESGVKTTKKNNDESDEDDGGADEDDPAIVPPVRKFVEQQIIARQQRTIKKLRSKQEQDDDGEEVDEEDNVGDQEISDDEKSSKIIGREVQKHLKPVIKALASEANENELQDLFAQEPDAKKYEKRIRTYMGHSQYQGVPPAVIFHHLAFGEAAQTTTRKKAAADLETRQTRGAGTGRRPTASRGDIPSVEDMEDMDDAQFEKLQHKARTGKFLKKDE